ncbi:MAG: 5-(carboxyamino)imidazole ribonucleotide mutase [Oscillospiraceae bacterium]|nr:5-(carboxyamino)imidazole ribonucleotide mutase [Oscillospiraceae bacterium]
MKKVAVIMGSDSDWPIVKPAVETLQSLAIPFEAKVMSAHRTPIAAMEFARSARENGFGALIAAAGKAAHLAGVLAGNTTLPVIGIPIGGNGGLGGLDALLATVQMPSGIPVATVAVDGAKNAALLAAQILGVTDETMAQKLDALREEMTLAIAEKNAALQQKLQEKRSGA